MNHRRYHMINLSQVIIEGLDPEVAYVGFAKPIRSRIVMRNLSNPEPGEPKRPLGVVPRAVFFTPQVGAPGFVRMNVMDYCGEWFPWWHVDQGNRTAKGFVGPKGPRALPPISDEGMLAHATKMFKTMTNVVKISKSDVQREMIKRWSELEQSKKSN